jgi:hypothetical protein
MINHADANTVEPDKASGRFLLMFIGEITLPIRISGQASSIRNSGSMPNFLNDLKIAARSLSHTV